MSTHIGGAFTISFAGVPVDDCYAITRIVESLPDSSAGRWTVLNTNATDVVLAGGNIHLDAMNSQVVARLGTGEAAQPGELVLSLPVTRETFVAMLEQARQKLSPDYVPSSPPVALADVADKAAPSEGEQAPQPVGAGMTWTGQISVQAGARPGFSSSLGLPPFAPAPMDTLYQRSTATAPHYQSRPVAAAHLAPPPPSAVDAGQEGAAVDAAAVEQAPEPDIAPHPTEPALDLQDFALGVSADVEVSEPAEPEAEAFQPGNPEQDAEAPVQASRTPSFPSPPPVLEEPVAEPPIFSPARAGGDEADWPGSSLRERLMAHMSDGASLPSSVAQFMGLGTPAPSINEDGGTDAPAASTAAPARPLGDYVWAEAAMAIYSIVQNSSPVIARIDIAGAGELVVDFRYRAFSGEVSVSDLSAAPAHVSIATATASPDMPPAFALPGQSLDKLLWFIGLHAFSGASAPWLRDEDRYRLQRWPNFTEMNYQIDHMRMTALMGNAFFNARELADAAGVAEDTAVRMLNAYSLMGLLQVSAGQAAIVPPVVQGADLPSHSSGGLFSKLRKKLGL